MNKVLITGVTGFLGGNIARYLSSVGYELAGTYRSEFSKKSCKVLMDKITWISLSENDWSQKAISFQPDIIIHSAWTGVDSSGRNDWEGQFVNLEFLKELLFIADSARIKKFIGLGSQAEYGYIDGYVKENHPLNPDYAYGAMKVICSELVRTFCNQHRINWYWLRLFSFIGKGETGGWLIPSVVKSVLTKEEMDLTGGEQKYAYLNVDDLAFAVERIIKVSGKSGIYNISSDEVISLKTLVREIVAYLKPSFRLNFGRLPYRENQSMHIQGDSSKFIEEFGKFQHSDFQSSLFDIVSSIREDYINKNIK